LRITVAVLNTFGKDFFLKPTFVVEGSTQGVTLLILQKEKCLKENSRMATP
jgi:hypothetical protein